jgi:chloride channel protein, CIC family
VSSGEVASRNFIVVPEDTTAYEVIRCMWRRNAIMAVVLRAGEVAGVITKEHVADIIKAFPE